MTVREYSKAITDEAERTLSTIDDRDAERLVDAVLSSNRIFVAGAGRSGFMARAFAMRLMHMGFSAYFVGETITPSVRNGDLLVVGSGSGETMSLVAAAGKAKDIGATLCLVSIFPQSSIGKLADIVVRIPASTPKGETKTPPLSIQPMGSLYEQTLLLFLDALILRLMERTGANAADMFTRHANLE